MATLLSTLHGLTLGAPIGFGSLGVYPLIGPGHAPSYWTLREAVGAGQARVREVSESGAVPQLLVENFSAKPILILDGEELIGAKQNRCANVTILAPAGQTLVIPVSCVEAGRWSYQSPQFAVADRAQFARGRAMKVAAVNESLRSDGVRDADQGQVWAEISAKSARMRVASPTAAMGDIYDQHRRDLDRYVSAVQPVADQVGAVFAIGDAIVGLDLFDAAETLRAMLPKLVRSYAIDAIESTANGTGPPPESTAAGFMAAVVAARTETYPGVGLGTDIRLTAQALVAGGLVYEGRIVHLAAFALPAATTARPANDDQFLALSMRRRRMMGR